MRIYPTAEQVSYLNELDLAIDRDPDDNSEGETHHAPAPPRPVARAHVAPEAVMPMPAAAPAGQPQYNPPSIGLFLYCTRTLLVMVGAIALALVAMELMHGIKSLTRPDHPSVSRPFPVEPPAVPTLRRNVAAEQTSPPPPPQKRRSARHVPVRRPPVLRPMPRREPGPDFGWNQTLP